MNIYITFYKSVLTDKIQRKNIIIGNGIDKQLMSLESLCDKTEYVFHAYQVDVLPHNLFFFYNLFYHVDQPPIIKDDYIQGCGGNLTWRLRLLPV